MSDDNLPPPPPSGPPGSLPPPPSSGPPGQWAAGPPAVPGANIPGGLQLAEPWARIGARLIDALILIVMSFVLAAAFIDFDDIGTGFNAGYLAVSFLMGIAYEVGFVGAVGGTPGKLALGLRVVSQETGATPPGWDKAGLRYLPSLVGLVPVVGVLASLAILIFSLVWLFSDDCRRTVYDRVATTYVVKI